jgi:hypothetical protein
LRRARRSVGIRAGDAPVSSAFLYLAIVAIWAFVLVPRWLRRQHAAPQPEYEADYVPDSTYYEEDGYDNPQDEAGDADGSYEAAPPADDPVVSDHSATAATAHPRRPRLDARVPATRPLSRSRVLQTRRRLLTMLVLLAAAAGTCTALKLTAWWVCIPPAVMLGMYLLLLRETAIADAERANWLAVMEQRRADRERTYLAQVPQVPDEQPSAEIIDISARVNDMLYDQYADATVRAVGD